MKDYNNALVNSMHKGDGRLQLRPKERTDQLANSPKTWESLHRRLPIREHYIYNFHSLNSFSDGRLPEKLIPLLKKKKMSQACKRLPGLSSQSFLLSSSRS